MEGEQNGAGARHGGRRMWGWCGVIKHGNRAAQTGNDLLHSGEREVLVVLKIQFAAPGIEQLGGGCSRQDLRLEIGYCGLSDAMEQPTKDFRLAIEETLDGGETFVGLAFHHVTGKSPRSTCKAQNGNLRTDGFHDPPDGFGQKARVFLRVKYLEPVDIRLGAHGIRYNWSGIADFQLKAHRFGWNQNVRENDDGVHTQPAKGLDGDFDGKLGRLASLKECMLCADFAVLGEIPACLAHHPHGNSGKDLPAAGAKE